MSEPIAPTIETERMLLRPWADDDVKPWCVMNDDARVLRFLLRSTRTDSLAQAERLRLTVQRDGYGWWIAEIKGGPRFAGVIALQDVPSALPFAPAKEVGWHFLPEVWGQGYATEGGRAALDFAFNELGWSEVVAMTARINEPSQNVMQRLGMTHDASDDFAHPNVPEGHPLRPHVLYRARRQSIAMTSRIP